MIIKLNEKNIDDYYFNLKGNIYYKYPDKETFELLVGFDIHDCVQAMKNKVEFIYIEGKAI